MLPFPNRTSISLKRDSTTRHVTDEGLHLSARVLGNKLDTLLDVLLEVAQASLNKLLLVGVNLANGQDLLNTVGAEFNLAGEEIDALVLEQRRVDKGRLDNALLASSSTEKRVSHAGTSHGHGESGGTGTVLGLDNLVTTELDALDEVLIGAQVGVVALAEERNDSHTRVSANNGDVLVLGVSLLDLGNESASADDVQGGDTEEGLGVVDTLSLEDLGADGDGRVHRVGNDEDLGLGSGDGNGLGQIAHNRGVGVEQIVTAHAGLSGNTGRDEDDVGTLDASGQTGGGEFITGDGRLGVDVGQVSSDTYCCRGDS